MGTPPSEPPPPTRVEAWAAGKDFRGLVSSLDEVGGIWLGLRVRVRVRVRDRP